MGGASAPPLKLGRLVMGCTIDSLSDEQIEMLIQQEKELEYLESFMPDGTEEEMGECIGPMPYQS